MLSLPPFLKSPGTNQICPDFQPTDITIFPWLSEWIQLSQHLSGYCLPVQHTLNGSMLFRLRTEKNYSSTWYFDLYFEVFKNEKVSVLNYHLWNINYENYFSPFMEKTINWKLLIQSHKELLIHRMCQFVWGF